MSDHIGTLITNPDQYRKRFMVGTPVTGLVRIEWVLARYGQTIPCNWSMVDMQVWLDNLTPSGFGIADARNLCVNTVIRDEIEWIFFLDSDVVLPAGTLVKLNRHMVERTAPIITGVYFTKSIPSEPVIYRGRGNGYFDKWTLGEPTWVDGCGLGCCLIHASVLKSVWDDSEEYTVGGVKTRRVFGNVTEQREEIMPNSYRIDSGTEDLPFFERVMNDWHLKKAGWPEIQAKRYPILVDTSILCKHIAPNGAQYPMNGEALRYMTEAQQVELARRSKV